MKRTSALRIRKIWKNENSSKNQVTVQFAQEVEGNSNPLLAITQGINSAGRITTLVSFAENVAQTLFGTTNFTASNVDDFSTYMELPADSPLANFEIEVVENTTQNPAFAQEPKINPTSGDTLLFDGKPIYRHTQLVQAPARIVLLTHNGVAKANELPVEGKQAEAADAGQKVI